MVARVAEVLAAPVAGVVVALVEVVAALVEVVAATAVGTLAKIADLLLMVQVVVVAQMVAGTIVVVVATVEVAGYSAVLVDSPLENVMEEVVWVVVVVGLLV